MPGFYRTFDFPGSDTHTPQRQETIVAQQALYLMNSGFMMEQAEAAVKQLAGESDAATRIERLYGRLLGRAPTAEERQLGLDFVRSASQAVASSAPADVPSNNVPKATEPGPWQYGWGVYDALAQRVSEFHHFPYFSNNLWRGSATDNDPILGRASLNARGGYAGPSSELAVVRRWTAPLGGTLSIDALLSHAQNTVQPLGDGVRARIVSSRHGELGTWIVCSTDEQTTVSGIVVERGDTIDFVVDARGREMHGTFLWPPVLRIMLPGESAEPPIKDAAAGKQKAAAGAKDASPAEKRVWDAAKEFAGAPLEAPAYDIWQRYAQVLLETNEFMFVD